MLRYCVLVVLILCAAGAFAQAFTFEQLSWAGGGPGTWDGTGGEARFQSPGGMAADADGNLYVADTANHIIRKITPAGEVTTLAGSSAVGSLDGHGAAAQFKAPTGIAVDADGNVYVTDYDDHTIRKITASGDVTTLAGLSGQAGSTNGTGSAARFRNPSGVTVDASGNLFVADYWNHTIRMITPAGVVTTFAGVAETPGFGDGTGSGARFFFPTGITTAPGGDMYVTEERTHRIRQVTAAAVVTSPLGANGGQGNTDGTGTAARFNAPSGITVDSSGTIYVADTGNHLIRKVTTPGLVVTKLAGDPTKSGSRDGTGAAASFTLPRGITTDPDGNVYVADTNNHTIRKVTATGVVTTFAGRAAGGAAVDGVGAAARVNAPRGLTVDDDGTIYYADAFSHVIRQAATDGTVTTIAGLADTPGTTNGNGSVARFNTPGGIALDGDGNLYVADTYNHAIRKITPLGDVTTLAGLPGTPGDVDNTGTLARFLLPTGVAVDSDDNVFVADNGNQKVKKVTPAGVVTTIASAEAFRLVVDSSGDLLVTDNNSAVRRVTQAGVVTTFAGSPGNQGTADGPRLDARFFGPSGIALDASGAFSLSDTFNHTFRRIASDGIVTTPAGVAGTLGNHDGTGTAARFFNPGDVAVDTGDTVYMTDGNDSMIKRGRPALNTDPVITPTTATPGTEVQLNVTQPATTYSWRVIRRPADSVAQLSSTTIANPTFTPDKADLYTFLLRAESASGLRIAEVSLNAPAQATSLSLWTLTPCRVIDSRSNNPLGGLSTMTITIAGQCGVPSGAVAVTVNLTAAQPSDVGFFALYPTGTPWGGTSTMNFRPGKTRANNAIVPMSIDGKIDIRNGSTTPTHFIIDVSGYFQ